MKRGRDGRQKEQTNHDYAKEVANYSKLLQILVKMLEKPYNITEKMPLCQNASKSLTRRKGGGTYG